MPNIAKIRQGAGIRIDVDPGNNAITITNTGDWSGAIDEAASALRAEIEDEARTRAQADEVLQENIDAEADMRAQADVSLFVDEIQLF